MNSSTNCLRTEPISYPPLHKRQTTRRSSFGNSSSQAFASLMDNDMYYNTFGASYTHPSSNNPSFFSSPTNAGCDSSHDPASSLPFPIVRPQCPADLHMTLPMGLDAQLLSAFDTPSPASSQMVITPISLHDEGQTVTRDAIQYYDNGAPMVTVSGSISEYVNPQGYSSLAGAIDCDPATKSSLCPRPSAVTSPSTWQLGSARGAAQLRGVSKPRPDAVLNTQTEYAFYEDTQLQANLQRRAPVYRNHKLTRDPPTMAHAQSPSLVSPPASIPPQSTPQPSSFNTLSSTTYFTVPLHQPQPIRPIPIIPLSNGTYAESSDSHSTTNLLPPHSLLCQPVSDAIRYRASVTEPQPTTSGTFSPTLPSGDSPDLDYYKCGLPKMFFCPCGCLGSKHHE